MYDVGEDKTREQECEVQLSHESNSRGGYQQYSSQDSLPDSPYSSQSLDSQSTQGAGRNYIINRVSATIKVYQHSIFPKQV